MKVGIIDYGMGNLGSVRRALSELGADPIIVPQPEGLADVDRMILPGVGSFADGMRNLSHWRDGIRREALDKGKPMLGICLGMQLLASKGTEHGDSDGLDLIPGIVMRIDKLGCDLRIPHVGWNAISLNKAGGIFEAIPDQTDFYFVHSFAFQTAKTEDVLAYTDYGAPLVAAVGKGCVFGTQFHPEKSSKAGFRILKNFLEFRAC